MGIDVELSLDSNPSSAFLPKTIADFLAEVSAIGDASQRASKLDDLVARLEDERRKIEAFKRELPISVLLVADAIARLREEAIATAERLESRGERAIEEFMPLKKKAKSFDEDDDDEEDDEDEDEEEEIGRVNSEIELSEDKRNWMSSAQLWSSNVDFALKPSNDDKEEEEEDDDDKNRRSGEGQVGKYGKRGGAFVPFKASPTFSGSSHHQQITSLSLMPQITTTTTRTSSNSNTSFRGVSVSVSGSSSAFFTDQVKLLPNKPQQQQTQTQQGCRKQRRCWSPELHRRFVDALQQLGGSQAATPKQIRELMQVEGLTNDEVKSHLQKYRLHVRKLPNSPATRGNGGGGGGNGLWMTQQEDHSGDNSKANMSISQSGSPQGPLLANGSHKAMSNTGGYSTEAEEDEERSDGHSWRSQCHNGNHKEAREA